MRLCVLCGHRQDQHREEFFECLVEGCDHDCDLFLGHYPEEGDPPLRLDDEETP